MARPSLLKKPIPIQDFLSDEPDIQARLQDYVIGLLGSEILDVLQDLWTSSTGWSGDRVIAAGLASEGQWYLWILNTFHSQVSEGGLSQFLTNWPDLITEVRTGLDVAQMPPFQHALDDLTEAITSYEAALSPRYQNALRSNPQLQSDLTRAFKADPKVSRFVHDFQDRDRRPGNQLSATQFALGLVRYVESHPSEFIQAP